MRTYYCPRSENECPNGASINFPDAQLSSELRRAYEEDGATLVDLAKALKRHHCTIRAAIISAGGSIRPGGPIRYI